MGGDGMTLATGGVAQDIDIGLTRYRIHTFTADDTFTVTESGPIEYLIVGGGGSGSQTLSNTGYAVGGGGAGGLISNLGTPTHISPGAYSVVVGVGGAGAPASVAGSGNKGGNSNFNGLTAIGGGFGGHYYQGAGNGGSGGGGGSYSANTSGGTGVAGQGFAGGAGKTSAFTPGGGGGGAGSVGGAGNSVSNYVGGNGGTGLLNTITGANVYYAGGGGGGSGFPSSSFGGQGGAGGGGIGVSYATSGYNIALSAGTNGLGGGSGAVNWNGSVGAVGPKGGDGVVVIRYVLLVNEELSADSVATSNPLIDAALMSQKHVLSAEILSSQVPVIANSVIAQNHGFTVTNVISNPVVVDAPLFTPATMPTEIRATFYDAAGVEYADGTVVYVYNSDGTFYEATTIGSITGYNFGVYPLAASGQVVVRFNEGDTQTKFMVVGPSVDEDGLVTNLLTAVQLIAGHG